ncbi:MAG TPA: HD-GYP domain-containing protein [Candidatus Saccharimonadaceae bacterium]|nr:HD-GYP domain-containing protein [Candidatus Saccharimonadaceae bacterium]
MTAFRDARHPRLFALYYAGVMLAAAALLARGLGALPPAPQPPLLIAILGLMVFIEASPVSLPGGGYATASTALDLPVLVMLGPIYAAALDVVCTLTVQGLALRKPVVRVAHNAAVFTLDYFIAAQVFRASGGHIGTLRFPADLPPLLLCGLALFLSNSVWVALVIGLTEGPTPWRVWQRNFQQSLQHHLSFVGLGALITVMYVEVGGWALVLCGLPFLVARHSFRVYVEIRSDLKDFVRALSEVLEEVDPYTRHHSVRVSQYAVRLARGLGVGEREIEEIEYAALVHDLGKIGPQHQHILHKPGSLTHEEQRTLRAHPAAGAEIVTRVRALRRAAEIVRTHHERPDGQGYPFGLRAQDVPLGARILNVSDAFDAMTSDRPYRRALSVEAALAELARGSGTQFDARVVTCLVTLHGAGEFERIPSPTSEDLMQLKLNPRRARG